MPFFDRKIVCGGFGGETSGNLYLATRIGGSISSL